MEMVKRVMVTEAGVGGEWRRGREGLIDGAQAIFRAVELFFCMIL